MLRGRAMHLECRLGTLSWTLSLTCDPGYRRTYFQSDDWRLRVCPLLIGHIFLLIIKIQCFIYRKEKSRDVNVTGV